jgi:oligosaccharide repeat unit polymerase
MATRGVDGAQQARPTVVATVTMLGGFALTSLFLFSEHAAGIFTTAAVGVGLTLSVGTLIEARAGIRRLIRVDLLMLWAFYGLTLLEFLVPQPQVDSVSLAAAVSATYAVLFGFAGLAVGRHLVPKQSGRIQFSNSQDISTSIFVLFLFVTSMGYLHILLAVNFDLIEALRQMLLPRFSQSWSRGRYGDVSAILYEIGALIYLIPPISGLVYARSKDFNVIQKIVVTLTLLLTMYYGFTSGTRNIIVTYVITFLGAYFLNKRELKVRDLLAVGAPVILFLLLAITYMLAFRQVGAGNFSFADNQFESVYIDRNMVAIARITEVFPNLHDYLGFEVPYFSLIHPIPRALWPNKPEALSVSIEAEMGLDPSTVSIVSTFVGEAYMSGGLLAVIFVSLLFGALSETWNRVGRNTKSPFAQLLYASGFFCALLTMRSMVWMTVTVLPTVALWLYGKLWLQRAHRFRSASH